MRREHPRALARLPESPGRDSTAAECASPHAGVSPPRVPGGRPRHRLRLPPAVERRPPGNTMDPSPTVSAVAARVPAAPSRGGGGDVDALLTTYAAGVEDLLARVERACAAAGTSAERISAGVAALLERLASRPDLARRVLIDAPSAGRMVGRARADAHRRFGELVTAVAGGPPASPETVVAGIRAIENLLAANLIGAGAASLTDLAPVVERVVASLGAGEYGAAPHGHRPRAA